MKRLGGLIACPDGSIQSGRIEFSERLQAVGPSAAEGDDYIIPGLVDLQVNGSDGIDVMEAPAEALAALSENLAMEGTTGWLPTAITAPLARIELVHSEIGAAMAGQDRGGRLACAAILGMHLEGPFIAPNRLGVHPPLNLEPRGEALERVLALKSVRLVTLAPELAGGCEAIRRFCQRGAIVSIGHSDATFEQAKLAIAAGARMFTHVFNAMRPMHHRDPGVVAAAMLPSPAMAAIIPDGVHVDPVMLRLLHRSRSAAGMIITTDKSASAGAPPHATAPGEFVIARGAARTADGTLAGSIISMLDGVRLMVEKVGVGVGEAALMGATNPSTLLGLEDRGRLVPGARADLIMLSRDLKLKAVFIGGRELG
jgi:N-acetylglucosamine-6-phosphate deacetylase